MLQIAYVKLVMRVVIANVRMTITKIKGQVRPLIMLEFYDSALGRRMALCVSE